MEHSSTSKKSNKDESVSDSEEEVSNSPSSLVAENARLNDLLDNRDDVLRKTNKEKREYRSFLGEAKENMVELEYLLDGARAQIYSLKSAPVVTNEPECIDCSTVLGELTVLKEKYASKVEELDVLRVELAQLQSRPTLLGACTSCPALHEKIAEFRSRIVSLEPNLKVPVPTSCSTCELHVVKNLELEQCVDHLQTENDDLRKLLSWLSSQEPQLGMMIDAFKRFDGQALGSDKVGECSGEREGKFGRTPVPPHTTPKNQFAPKPNQTHKPREKPSEKPSVQGNKHEKKAQPTPKAKSVRFHCEHCGRDGHKREFCFRRRREERLARVLCIRSHLRGIGAFLPEMLRVSAFGVMVMIGLVPLVVAQVMGMFSLAVVCLLDILDLVNNTSLGEVTTLSLRGATDHVFPFVVLVLLQRDVR
jgi:hypothetical protein